MPTILVTGATGTLGRRLIAAREASAYRIRGLSRRDIIAEDAAPRVEWRRADLSTGDGLDAALDGVDVVIHAASDPRGDTKRTDVDGTARLIAAAERARIGHLLYISVVGIDRIPVKYYQYKVEAEALIQKSAVPWTILRGTQFHDYMDKLCAAMTMLPIALVPAGFRAQPIHVDEFADAVWACVADGPRGRAPDVGGPEILTLPEILRAWMAARGMQKRMLRLPIPGRAAAALRRGEGTAPGRAVGRLTWARWLHGKYVRR